VEIFYFCLLPVGEVDHVELFIDQNDRPRGCASVEFKSADSVKKALEKMHHYVFEGRKLVVREVSRPVLEQLCLEIDSV
jgi:RNA recognition motif-containing protein